MVEPAETQIQHLRREALEAAKIDDKYGRDIRILLDNAAFTMLCDTNKLRTHIGPRFLVLDHAAGELLTAECNGRYGPREAGEPVLALRAAYAAQTAEAYADKHGTNITVFLFNGGDFHGRRDNNLTGSFGFAPDVSSGNVLRQQKLNAAADALGLEALLKVRAPAAA